MKLGNAVHNLTHRHWEATAKSGTFGVCEWRGPLWFGTAQVRYRPGYDCARWWPVPPAPGVSDEEFLCTLRDLPTPEQAMALLRSVYTANEEKRHARHGRP
jgi:hypothetical protein